MKVSEVIKQLEKVLEEKGDLRVTTHEFGGIGVVNFRGIRVEQIRAKRGREYKTYLCYESRPEDVPIETVVLL